MPDSRFDSLSKFLARGTSRRDALRALGGFLGIAALGSAKVAPADAQIACPPPLSSCNGVCVNSTNDPHNCGACNNVCPQGQFCAGGTCQCPTGLTLCGNTCLNLKTDPHNCGTCNNVCPQGQVCKSGTCQLPAGVTAICNGAPTNTQSDPTNCGACGIRCTPSLQLSGQCCGGICCTTGTVCLSGACSSLCNGQIANTQSDPNNCGSCGHVCIAPPNGVPTCALGVCGSSCSSGFKLCNGACIPNANCCSASDCTPPPNSIATCTSGVCGFTCNSGLSPCGSTCANLQNDNNNCGTCATVCTGGQTCASGVCGLTCNSGLSPCSGVCVNEQTDTNNCGACGHVCTPPANSLATCTSGVCGFTCNSGLSPCSGVCVNEQIDTNNCGACGHVCTSGQTCSGGTCSGSVSGSFVCPPQDVASFPLGEHSDSGGTLFCSYPAFPGEDPNDFFCTYSDSTGALMTDNDAGFCPGTAVSAQLRPAVQPNIVWPDPGIKINRNH